MPNIKQTEIDEFLGLYESEYRLVKNAWYESGVLHADLIPFRYIFTKEDLDYITATQIHLYLSQLTYLLIAKCLSDQNYTLISRHIRMEDFTNKMYAGRLFFVNINQKMKEIIYKTEKPIDATLKIQSFRHIKESGFCDLEFDINSGACVGTIMISMKISK